MELPLINKKYTLIEKIGEGSFGLIYKGKNTRTNEFVAIKMESIKSETNLLKNESVIYQYLSTSIGIPTVKWFGKDINNYYMVISLLGESLQTIKHKKVLFSLKLVLQVGVKIINLLKTIHDKGLVHRDIKPDNFLLGLNNDSKNIYIIDFGFCKSYMKDNKHIPQKQTHNLIGSQMYASINAHNFVELSRRDDLESLGYMLIYFYLGTLSWEDISNLSKNKNINENIKSIKQNILESNSFPDVLVNYIKYVTNLEFEENPNYNLIINSFKRELEILTKSS